MRWDVTTTFPSHFAMLCCLFALDIFEKFTILVDRRCVIGAGPESIEKSRFVVVVVAVVLTQQMQDESLKWVECKFDREPWSLFTIYSGDQGPLRYDLWWKSPSQEARRWYQVLRGGRTLVRVHHK